MTRWLETDTISSVDISTAATPVGAYTADADRMMFAQFYISCAGNGDYIFWMTLQVGGAGSEYRIQPRTTAAVASGSTAIAGQSTGVNARSGDILRIYIDGLAGDTSVSGAVRWFEMAALRPATADRTIAVDGSGLVDLVPAPNATAVTVIQAGLARTGADGDTLETLSDQIDGIDPSGTAAEVWTYATRTLTQTAAQVASVMTGTTITIVRGDSFSVTITGLGDITGYQNVWFTIKWATTDEDSAAVIQIDTTTGLLTVNGAAATDTDGTFTVDDATAGDITITLEATVTDDLAPATGLVYDVQWLTAADAVHTLTSGAAVVAADVTRAVA